MLCTHCNGQKIQKAEEAEETVSDLPPSFRMVTIPSVLVEPGERADYLVKHYWDNFNFRDTSYIHLPEITEQAVVDYIDVMPYAEATVVSVSVKEMLKKAEAEKTVFLYFTDLYEKYLYDPNSPLRNDEFFIPVLEAMLESPLVDEKIRPAHLLKLAKRNRQGETATDFTYTTSKGREATLYALSAEYTILFFYNPGCNNCKEVSDQLISSLSVQYFIKENKLKILALYPDEDIQAWRAYLSNVPEEWINAYDATMRIKDDEVYDLKAIPTIYLLDKEKKVLLKDPTFDALESYLHQQINRRQ
jgi:thiol-disulfide isomerase/thioredoxin